MMMVTYLRQLMEMNVSSELSLGAGAFYCLLLSGKEDATKTIK